MDMPPQVVTMSQFSTAIAFPLSLFITIAGVSCAPPTVAPSAPEPTATTQPAPVTNAESAVEGAIVTAVATTPQPEGGYRFAVTVQSPDTGCDQYADWWEVITPEGELLYRRILAHSHVDEQPFERSGGPVVIAPEQTVIVRAHMHPSGYDTQAMQGSPATGFEVVTLPDGFAVELAETEPQPDNCTF